MNKREILILRYLSTTINRLELVRSHLTEELLEVQGLNPTVTDESRQNKERVTLPLNELIWEVESKLLLISNLIEMIHSNKTSSSDTSNHPSEKGQEKLSS